MWTYLYKGYLQVVDSFALLYYNVYFSLRNLRLLTLAR